MPGDARGELPPGSSGAPGGLGEPLLEAAVGDPADGEAWIGEREEQLAVLAGHIQGARPPPLADEGSGDPGEQFARGRIVTDGGQLGGEPPVDVIGDLCAQRDVADPLAQGLALPGSVRLSPDRSPRNMAGLFIVISARRTLCSLQTLTEFSSTQWRTRTPSCHRLARDTTSGAAAGRGRPSASTGRPKWRSARSQLPVSGACRIRASVSGASVAGRSKI